MLGSTCLSTRSRTAPPSQDAVGVVERGAVVERRADARAPGRRRTRRASAVAASIASRQKAGRMHEVLRLVADQEALGQGDEPGPGRLCPPPRRRGPSRRCRRCRPRSGSAGPASGGRSRSSGTPGRVGSGFGFNRFVREEKRAPRAERRKPLSPPGRSLRFRADRRAGVANRKEECPCRIRYGGSGPRR